MQGMLLQLIKFCMVGGSGLVVDFGITYIFKELLKVNRYVANSIGFVCAATTNYILNRIWTFRSTDPQITRQYLLFLGIAVVGLGINNAVIYLLSDRLGLNFYLSKLVATVVVTVWNFLMNYFITFSL